MRVLGKVVGWLVVSAVVVLGFPFVALFLLGGGSRPVDECSTPRPTPRTADPDAADRLRIALGDLPGVTGAQVEFHPDALPGQVDGVDLRVSFAADAGRDQVLAAVAPAVDGLRRPEFAGLGVRLAFAFGPAAPASDDEAVGYHVLGLQSTDYVLDYAQGWFDLRAHHPAARVQLCRDDGAGTGIVARVPVVADGDAAPVLAAFADLEALARAGAGWARMSVRTTSAAGPPTEVEYAVADAYLDEDVVGPMMAAVRRPPAMAPTDELRAVVTFYPPAGHSGDLLDVDVVLGVDELRDTPAADLVDPPGRVSGIAAALDAQVRATDLAYDLTVELGDVPVLDEATYASWFWSWF